MEITDALIEKLAMLSRLYFNHDETQQIKSDLNGMIGFINKLNEVDTKNVEPLLYITSNLNELREDIIHHAISKEEALLNSPVKDAQFFKVPKVIRKQTGHQN